MVSSSAHSLRRADVKVSSDKPLWYLTLCPGRFLLLLRTEAEGLVPRSPDPLTKTQQEACGQGGFSYSARPCSSSVSDTAPEPPHDGKSHLEELCTTAALTETAAPRTPQGELFHTCYHEGGNGASSQRHVTGGLPDAPGAPSLLPENTQPTVDRAYAGDTAAVPVGRSPPS